MKHPAPSQVSTGSFGSVLALIGVFLLTVIVVLVLFTGNNWALAIATLGVEGLFVVLWLGAALGFGLVVLRAVRIECAVGLRVVVAIALGLGIISLLTMGLGCAGVLNRISSIMIIVVGDGCALAFVRRPAAERWAFLREPAHFHWLWVALAPGLAIALVGALLPPGILWGDEPNGYDVVEYHLQVPREWFEAGRIVPLTHNVFSYFPFNVEMHYLLAMHLRGGPWDGMYLAQLMHVSFITLTVAAVYVLLAEKHPRGAIVASVIAGGTPWMMLLAPVAYNEGGLLLFGTLAIGLSMRALEHPLGWKWMVLASSIAGFACGSKLTAAPMIVIPLGLIVAIGRFVSQRERGRVALLCVAIFWGMAFVPFAPWALRNTSWNSNPVFPEATSLIDKAHWSDAQVERWTRANHLPRADQRNLTGRLRAGWDQILADARFGYLLLPLAGIAIVVRRDRESLCLGALLLVHVVFWLFFTHLQSRFFVLSIPICALLIGRVKIRSWEWISTIAALAVAVIGTLYVTAKVAGIERKLAIYQIKLFSLTGLPSLRSFSRLPQSDDGRTVELVGEAQAFYYDIPMKRLYYRTVFDVDAQPGETAEQAWRKGWPQGPDVLVIVNDSELARFRQTYFGIP